MQKNAKKLTFHNFFASKCKKNFNIKQMPIWNTTVRET